MYQALLVVYLLVSIGIIFLVLLQQGKGAEMGGSLGVGASATLFGATGGNQFISRTTTILVGLFFAISLLLGNLSSTQVNSSPWQDLSEQAPLKSGAEVIPYFPQASDDIPK